MQKRSRVSLATFLLAAYGLFWLPASYALTVPPSEPSTYAVATQDGKIDLNTASLEELKALPGMGDAYAARVVKGRPYLAKNQLTQKGILPDAVYGKIKDRIIARQVKK